MMHRKARDRFEGKESERADPRSEMEKDKERGYGNKWAMIPFAVKPS